MLIIKRKKIEKLSLYLKKEEKQNKLYPKQA